MAKKHEIERDVGESEAGMGKLKARKQLEECCVSFAVLGQSLGGGEDLFFGGICFLKGEGGGKFHWVDF
ncbi:hypothetical protein [Bartonella raoultii]|uniref:hypothetical protein n=1 Tax=Bartonella raoultii TaxID=1457020 RepID=UPI001ABB7535|nr:hypothetical protein [Bartonella raoultii]